MNKQEPCRLCQGLNTILIYHSPNGRAFYQCPACGYTQLHSQCFVSPEQEKARYLLHENNVESEGYQNFLKPVVEQILKYQNPSDQGLDYGAGPSSVVVHMLQKKHYSIDSYDPIFHQDQKILNQKYDYLVCTEVVEHFKNPIVEFEKMLSLLKPQSLLFLKTGLTDSVKNFSEWHYHRDPTHVGFFNQKSLESLETRLSILRLEQYQDFVIFKRS